MDLIPLVLFICINFPPVFTGTTIRFNVRGNQLFQKKIPSSNPFYIPPSSSSSSSLESSLPSILLASTLASSMVTDALMIHKEMERESNADRRDSGIMESIKSGFGSATTSIGSRLDLKSGLNNLYDKFQPLWGRQATFGSMLSDITNTKSNEEKTFKLPASLAEKLGTSSITTSGSSSGSSVESSASASSTSSKWMNPFVNYPVARTTKSPAPVQTTPVPSVASSIRHQVVMPFSSVPGQSWSSSSSGQPWPPYPYAGYHGYRPGMMMPGMSASHPYAVVVPPPTTTTPAPPKTPRTIVIEEDEEEEEGDNGGKGGEISIGGIQAKQVLKLLGNAAASSGVNLGNVMQTVISTAVTSVAAGLAAARNQQPSGVNPFLPMAPIVPMQGYGQQQNQYGGQRQLLTQSQVSPLHVQPIQQQFQSQQIQSQQSQQQQTSSQSSEADTLSNNPKSKDEIIDDGDEEVIVIRRPKLKLPKPSSSNHQPSSSNHQPSSSNHQASNPATSIQSSGQSASQSIPQSVESQSSQPSLPGQIIVESLASQFQSFLSSAASSSQSSFPGSNHRTNEDTKSSDPSKSSAPYIKIGESKISFKPTNDGLSISFGKD